MREKSILTKKYDELTSILNQTHLDIKQKEETIEGMRSGIDKLRLSKMKLKELLVLKISSMLEIDLLSYFLIRIWFFNLIKIIIKRRVVGNFRFDIL